MSRRFLQVDVFGAAPWLGNPVAVVLDAEGLSTETMQRITRWLNLSETTFLLPPESSEADYRVRIFTLTHELPFAGHPTLGTCHAWLAAAATSHKTGRVVQECGAGLVPIQCGVDRLAFRAPPLLREGPVDAAFREQLLHVLGVAPEGVVDMQWVDNGPGWVGVLLADAESVLAVEPDFAAYMGHGHLDIGLVGPYPSGSDCAFEVRALFSDDSGGMREDPVTGSLNASLAQWLLSTGRAQAPFTASQGTRLGRSGRPRIEQDEDGAVWVGGSTVTCIDGTIAI